VSTDAERPSPDLAAAATDSATDLSPPAAARKPAAASKPRFALFIATACGLGYIPQAPGTFGSLAGLVIYLAVYWMISYLWTDVFLTAEALLFRHAFAAVTQLVASLVIAAIGVSMSRKVAEFLSKKDPQVVVVDEVSGQHLTLILGTLLPIPWNPAIAYWSGDAFVFSSAHSVLSWKYLLLGLILFRVFDIWKPFPVRQAESLPGGWGIMADDWVAAVYAAIGLWIARAAGL
jgi:phosphatidylglycerophosphatase A